MSAKNPEPGPYDRIAAMLLHELRAKGVIVVVLDGRQGSSGSVAAKDYATFAQLHSLLAPLLNPPTPPTVT